LDKLAIDPLQHALEISINIVVPKTQDSEAVTLKVLIPAAVLRGMFVETMLPAINFDNQTVPEAHKINNISVARRLAAKMIATCPPRTQMNPQLDLLSRHRLPQLAGALICHECPHPAGFRRPPSPFGGGTSSTGSVSSAVRFVRRKR